MQHADMMMLKIEDQARKLVEEARIWSIRDGVAGGDDSEATMILLVAAELIRAENGSTGLNPAIATAAITARSIVARGSC